MSIEMLLVLAVVQGLTEFLPVSSSGHLALLEACFGMKDAEANLALNVFLHFASVLAVVLFYRRQLIEVLTTRRRMILPLVIATVPAGVIGLLFEKQVEAAFSSMTAVACGWIGTGIALTLGQRYAALDRDVEGLGLGRAAGIGCAQAAAILPGLSRSGMTISSALASGLRADEATLFSFLLAIPVIFGASILKLPKLLRSPEGISGPVLLAGLVCFVVSYGALALLLRLVRGRRLHHFAWYVWTLAAVTLAAQSLGWFA